MSMEKLQKWFKRKFCEWFDHRWVETANVAITWAHIFHRRKCLRCDVVEEKITEHVYSD